MKGEEFEAFYRRGSEWAARKEARGGIGRPGDRSSHSGCDTPTEHAGEHAVAVKRRARKILLIVAALIASSPAFSETLRCGSSLVQPGVTVGFVQEKCGPPKSRETFSEPVMARRANGTAYEVGTTSKEVWRYQRGNGSFPALLTFEGGVLKKLEFEK